MFRVLLLTGRFSKRRKRFSIHPLFRILLSCLIIMSFRRLFTRVMFRECMDWGLFWFTECMGLLKRRHGFL